MDFHRQTVCAWLSMPHHQKTFTLSLRVNVLFSFKRLNLLFAKHFDYYPLAPLSIEFRVEYALPGA